MRTCRARYPARRRSCQTAEARGSCAITTGPYPLLLAPILKEKTWGGRRLQSYGKELPEGATIGESWEVADLPNTAPSGGGGGEARSRIINGPLAGSRLNDAVRSWGADLVGRAWVTETDFPLLVKLLDARETLSIQVHPTPEYASTHAGATVKTESWVVLEADPGAELLLGTLPGADRTEIAEATEHGDLPSKLRRVPARVGDCHHVPSGTIHAVGAGIVVAEFQSPSDTTFRLYDWTTEYQRPERPLHIEEALDAMTLDTVPPPRRVDPAGGVTRLVTTDHYELSGARVDQAAVEWDVATATVVMAASGAAVLISGAPDPIRLEQGATAVLPAACAARIEAATLDTTVLIAALSGPARSAQTGGPR